MRKGFVLFFIVCLLGILNGCTEKKTGIPEIGVSRKLADQRKNDIGELTYHLKFRIPENKNEQVEGMVKVGFRQEEVKPVILDFREGPEYVKNVAVNGRKTEVRVINEHIVIPEDDLVSGKNEINIEFTAGNQSLNRNDEFLYTLLVPERARTLFPCFDQPDLKAVFDLELDVPEAWKAVANGVLKEEKTENGRKQLLFAKTQPLSTYLFSFVAGKWQTVTEEREGRRITLFYRETDPGRIAQIPVIFNQVFVSLKWLEDYTGIPYPFDKYDLVIVPGFQFGGMEHAGAVLYNDKRMFLGPHPTVEEELGRMELIAHETAHMWFGDAVTMAWFDDVWTKEVFANYFAARMTGPQFPQVNHRLNDLRNFYVAAYSEDRTAGATSVKQPLENLKDAGLVYGQIVYNKAPIVMKKLVGMMGEEAFQQGIREYLSTYLYKNATWEDLIRILDKYTSQNLTQWSDIWVNEKGMPHIGIEKKGEQLDIIQQDPWDRGLVWPQQLKLQLLTQKGRLEVDVAMDVVRQTVKCPAGISYCIPDIDGETYGYIALDGETASYVMQHLADFSDPVTRLSLIMTLYENTLNGRVEPLELVRTLLKQLESEPDPLIISAAVGYVKSLGLHGEIAGNVEIEKGLLALSQKPGGPGRQQAAFRALVSLFASSEVTEEIYRIWKTQTSYPGLTLGENDYIKMAYELPVRMPGQYEEFLSVQTERIADPDRQKEFRFIARAVVPESSARDSLFDSLLLPENRRIEPWVTQMMYYLNHPLRQKEAVKYILPALNELREVQRTGDIFFPKNWVTACLQGHNSIEAAEVVEEFLREKTDYPVLLKNKILQSADPLFRLKQ